MGFDFDDIGNALSDGADAVGGAIADGAEAAVNAAGAVIDTFGTAAAAFGGAAVSFGTAAVETTAQAAEQAVIDAGEIVVDAAGRVLQITQDVWGDVVTDITDTAEGIAVLAEQAVEETAELAETIVEEVVTEVAEVAIDVGMWTWEATNYVQTQVAEATGEVIEFAGDLAEDVLHPVLDPILGSAMTQDLIDSGVQFGTIYATGGEAALRSFVNERVAEEAGAAERMMLTEVIGEDVGVGPAAVTEYGLLRAQGMDPMSAARAVGIDPASDAAGIIEEATAPLIGDDGAAAAANFARDLITVYGQQAADNFNDGGMSAYGDDGFDPFNPGATSTPHDPGWETTRGEVELLTDAGTEAYGELTEAIFEPVLGQDAAEQLGEYGPRIGVAVFRTIATGGLSGGEAVLSAARIGFETATGQGFEDFVGDSISTEWAETLGPEGARALGTLTETGLRLGLNYAASSAGGDVPDQNPDEDDLEAFKDAFLDLGAQAIEELTDIDPAVINRITLHIANDEWTDEDTQDLINGVRTLVPEENRDFYDSIHAASNGDQQGALMALQNRIPPQIGQAYQAQIVQDQALMAVTGSNPMAGVPILDRLGLGAEALNAIVAADETARGVETYTRPDNAELDLTSVESRPSPYADLPLEDVVAQEMTTATAFGSIASQSGDPVLIGQAQVLMAQAVAHQQLLDSGDEAAIAEALSPEAAIGAQQQVLVQALQMATTPGGAAAAGQLQALLAQTQAATQDLVEENGPPGPPSHYADLPLDDVVAQELSTANALLAIANQTGNAGIGQQAQVLMAQAVAHQQILASGDEDAIADLVPDMAIGAQNMALSQALGQAAAQGPGGTAAAIQVQSLLGQTQAQTDALYNQYGPPPAAVNETLAAATAIAQEQDLARTLNTMAAQAGPNAQLIAQQAQFLQAQARAHMQALASGQDANGNPVTAESVIASQQQALATSLQAAMVPTPGPGGIPTVTPGAQAVAGQLQSLLGQTQVHRDTLAERRADYDEYQRTHAAATDTGGDQLTPEEAAYQDQMARGNIRNPNGPEGSRDPDPLTPEEAAYQDQMARGNIRNPNGPEGSRDPEAQSAADADDFEENIMAPHLAAAPGTVRAQLDTDGDGQLSAEEISVRGIAGPNAVDDGGLEWEASSGDALTGDQPATLAGGTAPTATPATEPAEAPIEAAAPPPPPPEPAAPPVEAPAPEAEAAEPMPPPPVEESYEEPPAPPDPEPDVPEDDDGMV